MADKLTINPQRIKCMMEIFGLSEGDLLELISTGLKNKIRKEAVFTPHIKKSHLKKIDEVFSKGLSFYTDPEELRKERLSSVFFRKDNFNSDIALGDRQIVHKMETRIHSLSALSKLSGYEIGRKLNIFSVTDSPEEVASQVRENLHPDKQINRDRDFLRALIDKLAEYNILVLEFVESWNRKNKSNINGFFITPNSIVIKRQQNSLKREIFTLAHELGHYLLNDEQLDNIQFNQPQESKNIENWCDSFAFAFLVGNREIKGLKSISSDVKYNDAQIEAISKQHHISRLALFVHLAIHKRIAWEGYNKLKSDLEKEYDAKKQREQEAEKQLNKEHGKTVGYGSSKPIPSPLEKDIYTTAYCEGVIDEYEALSYFNKHIPSTGSGHPSKQKSLDDFLYE